MANNKYSKNMSDYQAETQHWPKNGSSFSELQENFHGVQTTLTSDRQHSYSQLFFFLNGCLFSYLAYGMVIKKTCLKIYGITLATE